MTEKSAEKPATKPNGTARKRKPKADAVAPARAAWLRVILKWLGRAAGFVAAGYAALILVFAFVPPPINLSTKGCSGASTTYVAPKIVSARVVKTVLRPLVFFQVKKIFTPWLLPIQFSCIATTREGQFSNFFKSSNNCSA